MTRSSSSSTSRASSSQTGRGRQSRPRLSAAQRAVAHVFDVSQTQGDPLSEIRPELLTGDAPAALWDALAAQVAAHGHALTRETCG